MAIFGAQWQREKTLGSRVALLLGKFFPVDRKVFQKLHQTCWLLKNNIFLDSLERFYLLWKSFQKLWKTLHTILTYYFMKNGFQTHVNILDGLEKFPDILEILRTIKFYSLMKKIPHTGDKASLDR